MVRRLLSGCGGRALDYGCGYGDITYAVSGQFVEIIGVDVDETRVRWASREFSPVPFLVCDGDRLEFPSGTFQTVLSIVVINWVDDADSYLREAHRVLARGGSLVMAVRAPDRMGGLLRRALGRPPVEMPFWTEALADMRVRLQRHGFMIARTDCFYDRLQEDVTSFKGVLAGLGRLPMRVFRARGFAPYYGLRGVRQ